MPPDVLNIWSVETHKRLEALVRELEVLPPCGYLDEATRLQVLQETLDWLQHLYATLEEFYHFLHSFYPILMGQTPEIYAHLTNVFRRLQGLRNWLQPACSVVECRLLRCMGRLFSFLNSERECNSFLSGFISQFINRMEDFVFNEVVMPTMELDEVKYMDAISTLLVGRYTFESISEFQLGVELNEMPDELHPMLFYYTVAMMANFFWGIWMFEMRPIEKLNIPIFMRHRLTHLLLKILDLIDRLVHQQKEYFSLLSALIESVCCKAIPIILSYSKEPFCESLNNITPPSTIAQLFQKLFSISKAGRSFQDEFFLLESTLYVSAGSIAQAFSQVNLQPLPTTLQLIYDEMMAFMHCIFDYFGRFTPRRFRTRPADYPGLYPPIGLALALANMDNEQDFIFGVLSEVLKLNRDSGEHRILHYLSEQTGQDQAALMVSSLVISLLCVPDAYPLPINGGYLLIHGLATIGKLPRRAVYWIMLSLMYSIVFPVCRFSNTKAGQQRYIRHALRPSLFISRSEDRLRTRLKQTLGIPLDINPQAKDHKVSNDYNSTTVRVDNFVAMSQCMMVAKHGFHFEALQICFNVGVGVRIWKRRIPEEELGFQHLVEELTEFMNNVLIRDRMQVVKILSDHSVPTNVMRSTLADFFKSHHKAHEKAS